MGWRKFSFLGEHTPCLIIFVCICMNPSYTCQSSLLDACVDFERMFHLRLKGFFSQLLLQLWGFSVLTTFGMIVIYPNFIAPLFNKFKVLGDRELRSKIDALVRAAGTLESPLLMKWISTFQPIRGNCRMMHTRCLLATPTEEALQNI